MNDRLQLRWERFTAALAKAVVFDALAAAGITHICVGFNGEGDQGQLEHAAAQADG